MTATLKREIPDLIPVDPEGGKEVRAHAVTHFVEAGNVSLPCSANAQRIAPEWLRVAEESGSWLERKYVRAELTQNDALGELVQWVDDYVEGFAAFPKGINDDQLDMTTQVSIRIYKGPRSEKRERRGSALSAAGASAAME